MKSVFIPVLVTMIFFALEYVYIFGYVIEAAVSLRPFLSNAAVIT